MKKLLLDANVLVRFLVQDDPKHSAAAAALFEKSERGEVVLLLDALVVAEVVYVLMGPYGRTRTEVVNVLLAIIQNAGVETMDRMSSPMRCGGSRPSMWIFQTPGWRRARLNLATPLPRSIATSTNSRTSAVSSRRHKSKRRFHPVHASDSQPPIRGAEGSVLIWCSVEPVARHRRTAPTL